MPSQIRTGVHVQHHAEDDQPDAGVGADAGRRDGGVADRQRGVGIGVLQGVAGLVGGNAHRRQRPALIDLRAQPQHLLPRVVVVAQASGYLFDRDVAQSGGVEDVAGGRRAAQRGRHLLGLPIGRMDPQLRPQPQQDRGSDEQEVPWVEEHAISPLNRDQWPRFTGPLAAAFHAQLRTWGGRWFIFPLSIIRPSFRCRSLIGLFGRLFRRRGRCFVPLGRGLAAMIALVSPRQGNRDSQAKFRQLGEDSELLAHVARQHHHPCGAGRLDLNQRHSVAEKSQWRHCSTWHPRRQRPPAGRLVP